MDPYTTQYSSHSPYGMVANNPIIAFDPNGKEIIIFFSVVNRINEDGTIVKVYEGMDVLKSIIDQGLAGQFVARFEEVGSGERFSLQLDPTSPESGGGGDLAQMSNQELAFFSYLKQAIHESELTALMVSEDDPNINYGSIVERRIDVGDMVLFNSISQSSTGSTQQGLLIHEIIEQQLMQKSEIRATDRDAIILNFEKFHAPAISIEDAVNGNSRLRHLETETMDGATIRYVEENDCSITREKTSTEDKCMKLEKQTNVTP